MDYEEIIEQIKSGLTGDIHADLVYLEQQAAHYKTHEDGLRIAEEISNTAYSILPEDRREEVNRALFYDGVRLDHLFEEARKAVDIKEFGRAIENMKNVTDTLSEHFADTPERRYITFRSPLEYQLYNLIFKPEHPPYRPPFNMSEMYRFYGFLLLQARQITDSVAVLEKAIRHNPMNSNAYLELCEAHKLMKNAPALLEITKSAAKIAASSAVLAACYANMGFYCFMVKDYSSAVCFYCHSLKLHNNPKITADLSVVRQALGTGLEVPAKAEIYAAFRKYDMRPGANDVIITAAYELGLELLEKQQLQPAKYCLGIAYDLTNDEEIGKMVRQIK